MAQVISKEQTGLAATLERVFQLKANNTTIKTEIVAGFTTFMTMVYIIFVNPNILSDAGMSWNGVFIATILASALGTLVMAFTANYPFALAPGMGLNAVFAYVIVGGMGVPWQTALGIVFLEGLIFIALSVTSVRSAIVNSMPMTLKSAIGAGIGLFIAFIGFSNSGLIVADAATLVTLGDISSGSALVTLVGLLIAGVAYAYKVKGALLWSILGATLFGMIPGVNVTPAFNGIFAIPAWGDFSSVAFQLDIASAFSLGLVGVIVSLLIVDLFDTAGTLVGVANQAGYLDENGHLPKADKALLSDAIATAGGAILGTSTTTTYVESASGVSDGGRTGLTGVTVAVLFLLSLFFMPLVGMVPAAATAPALIVVGIFMMKSVLKVDWEDFTEALPAFLCMITMPFAFGISEGIAIGFVSYSAINILTGKAHKTNWLVNSISVLFIVYFAFLH